MEEKFRDNFNGFIAELKEKFIEFFSSQCRNYGYDLTKEDARREIEKLEEAKKTVRGSDCEVYSRVVGYLRPVKQWNKGKQEEFKDRKTFAC